MIETPQPERTPKEQAERVQEIRKWNIEQVRGWAKLREESEKWCKNSRLRCKRGLGVGPRRR
jgi:hypothetical protein